MQPPYHDCYVPLVIALYHYGVRVLWSSRSWGGAAMAAAVAWLISTSLGVCQCSNRCVTFWAGLHMSQTLCVGNRTLGPGETLDSGSRFHAHHTGTCLLSIYLSRFRGA